MFARFAGCLVVVVTLAGGSGLTAAESAEQIFEKHVRPIYESPAASSCVQCHLAAVDLKDYLRPTHRESYLSLRDQGLIDLDNPAKSRILALIDMGKAAKPAATGHDAKRTAEHEAFAAWIAATAADPATRTAPKLEPAKVAKPKAPDEVIRHARKDHVLDSFENTVWAMRFRCMGCHTEGTPQYQKHFPKHGAKMGWFKPTAAATLDYVRGSKLLDVTTPEKSLLLLKPLNEEEHGGGVKFKKGDQGYRLYKQFLDDYARTVTDGYTTAAELPKADPVERFGTDAWLKITNTPPAWADKLVAVQVFAWDTSKKSWEPEAAAHSDRKVWGKGKLWQHTLTLEAPRGSDRAKAWRANPPSLKLGRYLVKAFVEGEYTGSAEVTSNWPGGYGTMTALDGGAFKH